VVVHRITAYSKVALWDGVKAWFDGGEAATSVIDPKGDKLRADADDQRDQHLDQGGCCE
jgi:hypothetical protein